MKRLLASLCALGLTAAMPPAKPANYDAFGITALQRIAAGSPNQNVFISPVSIGMALSMAAQGARGQTRSEITRVIGASGDSAAQNQALLSALSQNGDAQVGVANAIWFRQDIQPRGAYVRVLKSRYHAQAQALRFGDPSAAAAINAWTRAHTLGLIDRLVGQTYKTDFAYLTNALAFNANWQLPFSKNQTRLRQFTDSDGTKHDVPTMSQTATFDMLQGTGYTALRMKYGKGGYAAFVLLPDAKTSLDSMVKSMTAQSFERLASYMRPQRVQVMLPKFSAQYDVSLSSVLKALGMRTAFTGSADFSGIHAPPPGLLISDVHHATYVRVDEKGTTAAAATSVEIGMTAVELPPMRFIVDRPFILALRDERTGTLLFIGVINKIG